MSRRGGEARGIIREGRKRMLSRKADQDMLPDVCGYFRREAREAELGGVNAAERERETGQLSTTRINLSATHSPLNEHQQTFTRSSSPYPR